MSVQDNNDAMTPATSENPVQPLPSEAVQPTAVQTELPQSLVVNENGPPDYEEQKLQYQLMYVSDDFAPNAHGLMVHSKNDSKRELSDVVMDIIECVQDPEIGDHPIYPLNDTGISRLFADSYKYKLRYVQERGKWYAYDEENGIWAPNNFMAMECCKDFLEKLRHFVNCRCTTDDSASKRLKSAIKKWECQRARKGILNDAASVHHISMSKFDRDPFIFNCTNGTFNLKELRLMPHSPTYFLTKRANVAYDPKAECPRWRRHMQEVFQGDEALISYLQKALGYALTGDTSYECFFILFGPTTRNGKGVTMNTFAHMLGDYACTAQPASFMQKKYFDGSAPSEDIARLAGARFVNVSEPAHNMVLSSDLVKTLTGNDTITARRLHENSFEYKPAYKIFFSTNHLPKVADPTIFTSGRVKVLPFMRHFKPEEQDTGLKNELIKPESLSGILNWCIDGLRYLSDNKFSRESFVEPDPAKEAAKEYAEENGVKLAGNQLPENDDVLQFIEEILEASPGSEIRAMSAYGRYCVWCEEKGYAGCSQKMFSQKMGTYAKITRKRPADKSSTNPLSMIIGYKFKSKD